MCDAIDLDRLFAKISARLYPIDATTGLRIYNPDGQLTKLSHPGLLHATSPVAFIAQV